MPDTSYLSDGTCYWASKENFRGNSPVVFIHGVGMSHEFWSPQLEEFQNQRFCVAYDMLGHGDSPLPPVKATLNDYAQQMDRLLDALGIKSAIIVGHSMGALVALQYALTKPERVSGVVAMNAVFLRTSHQKESIMRRLHDLSDRCSPLNVTQTLKRWFGDDVEPTSSPKYKILKSALENVNITGYTRSYALFATSDAVHSEELPRLAMPACFLTGELDPNSTPRMSEAMARIVPDGYAISLKGERHMMSFLAPATTNAVISQFFSKIDALTHA